MNEETTKPTLAEYKAEAAKRLELLGFDTEFVDCYRKSPRTIPGHISDIPSMAADIPKDIEDIERNHNAYVYFVLSCKSAVGDLISYFLVTSEKTCWEQERKDIKECGYVFTYTRNLENDLFSEYGTIAVTMDQKSRVLVRTY